MSVVVNEVEIGLYLDSVALMRISAKLNVESGVEEAALMMATPANRELMSGANLLTAQSANAAANDLVIAIRGVDESSVANALVVARAALEGPTGQPGIGEAPGAATTVSLAGALERLPDANLALISVPGAFAAVEAHRALSAGLDVMVFSDNVPIEDEIALKERGRLLGRLVMGPDCGTSLVAGTPLGFANAIPRGDVGVVSASGTGLQEFSVLLANAGLGLSHGLGVGGRDLSDAVAGLGALSALEVLVRDAKTARIVLISKPPSPAVSTRLLEALAASGKPSFACFIGLDSSRESGPVTVCGSLLKLAQAVTGAASLEAGRTAPAGALPWTTGKLIRGLYAGGTLCAEAQHVLLCAGLEIESNAPLAGALRCGATLRPGMHCLLDLGADEYTLGRPHPMLEPSVRSNHLEQAIADPEIGVILLDVVLGYGAHPDPAGAVADTLNAAQNNPRPLVVASLCGVQGDPQSYQQQRQLLERAGVEIFTSTARACEFALSAVAPR